MYLANRRAGCSKNNVMYSSIPSSSSFSWAHWKTTFTDSHKCYWILECEQKGQESLLLLRQLSIYELCTHFFFFFTPEIAAKSLQSCPTLSDPRDGSPPGSPVPGILQAGTLEWVAISFSNAWKWKVKVKSLSCVRLLATPWTAAYQAPPSMGFSRQEYWSGVPLPSVRAHIKIYIKVA